MTDEEIRANKEFQHALDERRAQLKQDTEQSIFTIDRWARHIRERKTFGEMPS